MVNTSAIALGVALFVSIAAFLYNPIVLRLEIFGILRQWKGIENLHGEGLVAIPDLFGVEDIHYHEPTGIIFGLTEENLESRRKWFPPYALFFNLQAGHTIYHELPANKFIAAILSRTRQISAVARFSCCFLMRTTQLAFPLPISHTRS